MRGVQRGDQEHHGKQHYHHPLNDQIRQVQPYFTGLCLGIRQLLLVVPPHLLEQLGDSDQTDEAEDSRELGQLEGAGSGADGAEVSRRAGALSLVLQVPSLIAELAQVEDERNVSQQRGCRDEVKPKVEGVEVILLGRPCQSKLECEKDKDREEHPIRDGVEGLGQKSHVKIDREEGNNGEDQAEPLTKFAVEKQSQSFEFRLKTQSCKEAGVQLVE